MGKVPELMSQVDWEAVHRRMEADRALIEQAGRQTGEASRVVLRRRARELGTLPAVEPEGELLELVEFRLAHERYGIESRYIPEVCMLKDYTPIPCTPAFVIGVINLRGRIVSVIDLKKFYSLPERGLTDLNRVIILRSPEMEFGVLADEISGVRSLLREQLHQDLPTLTGIRREYLVGIAGDQTIVLDGQRLLEDCSLVVDEQP